MVRKKKDMISQLFSTGGYLKINEYFNFFGTISHYAGFFNKT